MFKALIAVIFAAGLTGSTGAAYIASTSGWSLPGLLEKPVSIRQSSPGSTRGATFLYFGTRRHLGGGYGFGK